MQSIIISLLFFASAGSLGIYLWSWVWRKKQLNIQDVLFSFIPGIVILTYLIFLLSWIFGQMITWINFVIIGSILIISLYLNIRKLTFYHIKLTKKFIFAGFSCLVAIIYFWLVFQNLLFYEKGNLMAGWITVWGDWQAHLTYIASFAYGNNFPPQLPIFAGQTFSYPFMADFLSAILVNLGSDLNQSLIIPSFILTTTAFFLLLQLVFIVTKRRLTAFLATLLFFFNGGLGFIYVLYYGIDANEMTKILDKNIQWISILTSQFIPQRGFTLGFPLALVCMYFLFQIIEKKGNFHNLFFFGLITALLPLIHMHSFLIIICLSAATFIFRTKYIREWIIFSLPILFISIPIYLYFYSKGAAFNAFRFHFGWMSKNPQDFIPFYVWNFGLMTILPILGFIFAPKKLKFITIPFWMIFILANLFIFQPWDWDNTKLLTYWYLGAAILAAWFLDKIIQSKYTVISVFGVLLFAISIFSGFSDARTLLNREKNKLQMFSFEQIQIAEFIKNNTPAKSIFLTADNHDNLVPSLTGRKIALGYPGWLWSYGVNYPTRQQEINLIKNNDSTTATLLNKLNINYVIIGPVEISQNFKNQVFENKYKKVFDQENYAIYQIQ